jgi:sarcosine oxidase, subunit alpha
MRHRPGPYRLTQGGVIDRGAEIPFRFNRRSYRAFEGDTLASALLANGVRTVGRSFKFHRPRGIFTAGYEEPNAFLQLGRGAFNVPAARAPMTEVLPGLEARTSSGWPNLQFDLLRVLDFTAPLWSAGFYNKTFIWPNWHTYEPFIRRMAGLGTAPKERDPDRYETGNLHCDVLVVGGGVAGLQAALAAGRAGARVILAEQHIQCGGWAAWEDAASEGARSPGHDAVSAVQKLKAMPEVRVFTRTSATGFYDHQVVTLSERISGGGPGQPRERLWLVRAKHVVLATGAIEQPLVFTNNDRPGIMLAGAARQYLRRFGVAFGSNVLIATNNDSAYALAIDLHRVGVSLLGIADSRHEVPQALRSVLQALAIPIFSGSIPTDTKGFSALRQVRLGRLSLDGTAIMSSRVLDCDALAVSGGFNPALQLYAHAGGKLFYDEASGALLPSTTLPGVEIVGAASQALPIGPRVSPVGDPKRKWVDLLHDVTVADLKLALQENYTSVEHVKRYTTVGMAADQGKTSTVATLQILGSLRGITPQALGHTTMRPPVTPVTLGAIAGRETGPLFAPHRCLPMHDWHVRRGALLQDFGEWRRPVAYPKSGETRDQAVKREGRAVRTAAGLLDGSSLGKIEIHGPDAVAFLDRFYINDLTTLRHYRARYGFMLRETGVIFDDGTVVMQAPDRLVLTTTSGNAARVGLWLEEWHQCEWPGLRVAIVPVTDCWATVSLAGPLARQILAKLPTDIDLSTGAFPHLSMREGALLGVPARIYRVSFTGELTYEINVPADRGPELWEALMTAGVPEGLEPLGLDALNLMRLEKGFLHLGSDTDGTSVPDDIGWGRVAANKKGDFIGKRSLFLPENVRTDRLQLVGLQRHDTAAFEIGSHLRVDETRDATDGWVTSAGRSVLSNEPIALAMVRAGRSRMGESVRLYDAGTPVGQARIVNPPFYDASGDRMNG